MNYKILFIGLLVSIFSCSKDDIETTTINDKGYKEHQSLDDKRVLKNSIRDPYPWGGLNPNDIPSIGKLKIVNCNTIYSKLGKYRLEIVYTGLSSVPSRRRRQVTSMHRLAEGNYNRIKNRLAPDYVCKRWIIPNGYSTFSYNSTKREYTEFWYEYIEIGKPSRTVRKKKIDVRSPQL